MSLSKAFNVDSKGNLHVWKQHLSWGGLGPVLLNIFINNFEEAIQDILIRFVGDMKLGETADAVKGLI